MEKRKIFGEKRVAVWGLGSNFKSKKSFICDYICPVLYVDKNSGTYGGIYEGMECCSPDELEDCAIDVIVLTPEDSCIRAEMEKMLVGQYELSVLNYLWDEYEMQLQDRIDFGMPSDRVVKRLGCGVGNCLCNMQCSYCSLDFSGQEKVKFQAGFNHSISFMIKALSRKRMGGRVFLDMIGSGETLLKPELTELVHGLLKEGHYIKLTTNGTVTHKIDELLAFEKEFVQRMMISFSMHYLELKKQRRIDEFFDNVNKVREAGASVQMSIVGCDEYLPYLDEIIDVCMEKAGFLPVPVIVRADNDKHAEYQLDSKLDRESYFRTWGRLQPIKMEATKAVWHELSEECYAGIHTGWINLQNGFLRQCANDSKHIDNIYDDITRPVRFLKNSHPCNLGRCICFSMSLSGRSLSSGQVPTFYESLNMTDKDGVSTVNETMRSVFDFINEN